MCRNSRKVIMLDIWVNMVHNKHNILEGRSLSGRGDSNNISPQEFIEIQGRALDCNLGKHKDGDRIQAFCTQI